MLRSSGYILPCQNNTVGLTNGTKVRAEIKRPASILFCVTTDRNIYSYVYIIRPRHRLGYYNDDTTKDVYLKFTENKNNININITIKSVIHWDLGVNFHVKICTDLQDQSCRSDQEFVIFTFMLEQLKKQGKSHILLFFLLSLWLFKM